MARMKASSLAALRRLGLRVRKGKSVQLANGRYMRLRRGRLVEIPPEWVGQATSAQQIRQRKSKKVRKLAKRLDRDWWRSSDRMDRERQDDLVRRFGADRWGHPVVGWKHGLGHPRNWTERTMGGRATTRLRGREEE